MGKTKWDNVDSKDFFTYTGMKEIESYLIKNGFKIDYVKCKATLSYYGRIQDDCGKYKVTITFDRNAVHTIKTKFAWDFGSRTCFDGFIYTLEDFKKIVMMTQFLSIPRAEYHQCN